VGKEGLIEENGESGEEIRQAVENRPISKGVENLDRQIGEGKVYAARFEFGGTGWNELLGSSNPCDYAALRIWTGVAGRLSQKPGNAIEKRGT